MGQLRAQSAYGAILESCFGTTVNGPNAGARGMAREGRGLALTQRRPSIASVIASQGLATRDRLSSGIARVRWKDELIDRRGWARATYWCRPVAGDTPDEHPASPSLRRERLAPIGRNRPRDLAAAAQDRCRHAPATSW